MIDKTKVLIQHHPFSSCYALPGMKRQPITAKKDLLEENFWFYVENQLNWSKKDIISNRRNQTVVFRRHLLMYCLKQNIDISLKKIGKMFGNRDHSTVVHAIKCINNYLDTDDTKRKEIIDLKNNFFMFLN